MKIMIVKKWITSMLVCALLFNFIVPKSYAADEVSSDNYRIMVSMGDSYSAGEGIEKFYGQEKQLKDKVLYHDWLAHRSQESWPGRLTIPGVSGTMKEHKYPDSLNGVNWYFTAVSGAKTEHINNKQDKYYHKEIIGRPTFVYDGTEYLDAQIDIFKQIPKNETDYVTLTMGGNDAEFTKVVEICAGGTYKNIGKLYEQLETTWDNFYKKDGIRQHLLEAYRDISAAAGKQARIIVAGYPRLFNETGAIVFIHRTEAEAVNDNVSKFNDEIEKIVNECGDNFYFVPVEDKFKDHGAYSDEPFLNAIMIGPRSEDITDLISSEGIMRASAYSMHPNAKGAQAYADAVQEKINKIEGMHIKGRVIDEDGKPQVGMYVYLIDENKNVLPVAMTGYGGYFEADSGGSSFLGIKSIEFWDERGCVLASTAASDLGYGMNDLGTFTVPAKDDDSTWVIELPSEETEHNSKDFAKVLKEYKKSVKTLDKNTFRMVLDADINIFATDGRQKESAQETVYLSANIKNNNKKNMEMSGDCSVSGLGQRIAYSYYYQDGETYYDYSSPRRQKAKATTRPLEAFANYQFEIKNEDVIDGWQDGNTIYLTVDGSVLALDALLGEILGQSYNCHCDSVTIALKTDEKDRPQEMRLLYTIVMDVDGINASINYVESLSFSQYGEAVIQKPDNMDVYDGSASRPAENSKLEIIDTREQQEDTENKENVEQPIDDDEQPIIDYQTAYKKVLQDYLDVSAIPSEEYFYNLEQYEVQYPNVNHVVMQDYHTSYHESPGAEGVDEDFSLYYQMYDIDGNGTPELIIYRAFHEMYICDIYAFDGHSAVKLLPDITLLEEIDYESYYLHIQENGIFRLSSGDWDYYRISSDGYSLEHCEYEEAPEVWGTDESPLELLVGDVDENSSTVDNYSALLDMFYDNISTNWEYYQPPEYYYNSADSTEYVSYIIPQYYSDDDGSILGYTFIDLDGNGVSELLIGTIGDEYDEILDLYTIVDGEVIHLASSGERYLYELCDDNTIYLYSGGGAGASGYDHYCIQDGKKQLEVLESIQRELVSWGDEPVNNWYYATEEYYDRELEYIDETKRELIDEDTANEIINSWPERVGFELTPFAEYSPQSVDSYNSFDEEEDDFDYPSIPDNALYYNEHYYAIYNYKEEGLESFDEVVEFCSDLGGNLAVINSDEENARLYQYVRDSGLSVAFFGYTDEYDEGNWYWIDGYSDYENWADGQPNNGATNKLRNPENYAEFAKSSSDGTWGDAPFGKNTYHFICEWDYS